MRDSQTAQQKDGMQSLNSSSSIKGCPPHPDSDSPCDLKKKCMPAILDSGNVANRRTEGTYRVWVFKRSERQLQVVFTRLTRMEAEGEAEG